VTEYELWSRDWKDRVVATKFRKWPTFGRNKSGHIALQDHDNRVGFRSIRVKALP
jgi:hypothetical protein